MTQGVLILLVVTACAASRLVAQGQGNRGMRLVSLSALPLTLAGVVQIRFLMMASALLVVVLAHLLIATERFLRSRLAREPARTRTLGRVVLGVMILLVVAPTWEYATSIGSRDRPSPMLDGIRLLRRLGQRQKQGAPDRTHHEHHEEREERGAVLGDWIWGHHILYFARLPAVASPFILGADRDKANHLARQALLATRPTRLYQIMEQRQARYLLVTRLFSVDQAATAVGLPPPPRSTRRPAAQALLETPPKGWSRLRLRDVEGNARLFELVQ